VSHAPDYDPIRKSWRESKIIDRAWLKDGEKLTWMQRIGFAILSLCIFSGGLVVATSAVGFLRDGDLFSLESLCAIGGVVVGICFLILGTLGLKNVLRF
jgi:hypothetical protein